MPRPSHNDNLKDYFTGATYLRDLFKKMLATQPPQKRLLLIHGVGGIGKSSLIKMFLLQCQELQIPVAHVSGDEERSAVDLLSRWAEDLREHGFKLQHFTKTEKRYRAIQMKVDEHIQKARAARDEAVEKVGKAAIQTILSSATAGLPGVGLLIKDLGGVGTEALVDWFRGFLASPEIDLLLDPVERLTSDFQSDLSQLALPQKVVLIIDSFEQMTALESWIGHLAQHFQPNILLVVAGRSTPNWERVWPGWLAQAYIEEIHPMAEESMRILVNRYYATMRGGQPDPQQVENIIRFARGLPLVVATAVRLWAQYGIEDFQSVKSQVVADLVDRLLEGVSDTAIPVLQAAAIVRWFNKELLGMLLKQDLPHSLYLELQRFPFVRPRSDGLSVHDSVREIIDENLRIHDPAQYRSLHRYAAEYFHTQAQVLQAVSGLDEAWQRLVLEEAYHLLRADEHAGIDLIQRLFEQGMIYTRYHFCKSLLSDAEVWSVSSQRTKHRIKYYKCRLKIAEFSPAYVSEQEFEELVLESDIDPTTKWAILLNYALFIGFTTVNSKKEAKYRRLSLQSLQDIGREYSPEGCIVLAAVSSTYYDEPYKREYLGKRAIAISEQIKQPYYAYDAFIDLGHLYLDLDQFALAEHMWRSATQLALKSQNDASIATAYNCLSQALMAQQKLLEAEEVLNAALRSVQRLPNILGSGKDKEMHIKRHFGILYHIMGDHERSIRYYTESLDLYRQRKSIIGRLRTMVLLTGCLYEAGQQDEIKRLEPEIESLIPPFPNEVIASWMIIKGHILVDQFATGFVQPEDIILTYSKALSIALATRIPALDDILHRILWKMRSLVDTAQSRWISVILLGIAEFWRHEGLHGESLVNIEREKRQLFDQQRESTLNHSFVLNRIRLALTQGLPDCEPAIWRSW